MSASRKHTTAFNDHGTGTSCGLDGLWTVIIVIVILAVIALTIALPAAQQAMEVLSPLMTMAG